MMKRKLLNAMLSLSFLAAAVAISPGSYAAGNLLSAGWGLDHPNPAFPDCPESLGQDGMTVVLDREVDNQTLDATDFEVELASGVRQTPICATLLPAHEENEDRTVLLIGDLGSQDDPPRWARMVGEVRGEDLVALGGVVPLPEFYGGPSLVLVEPAVLGETDCPADSAAAVRLIFSGGVLSVDGDELASTDIDRFTVETLDGVGSPIAFSDLNDLDNNLELCLSTESVAVRVTVQANTVIDPNGDPNMETSSTVDWPDGAIELNGIWYDADSVGEGFTITQGNEGTVVYFYGYDAFGDRLWLISDQIRTNFFSGDTVSVAMYQGEMGAFDWPGSEVIPWGTLTMTVESCESVEFELAGTDGEKFLQGQRLADGGRECHDSGTSPFSELYAQGIDRYLGAFSPDASFPEGGGVTTYTFSEQSNGPLCFTGNEYSMSTRDGSSNDLMIFLMGGGACGPQGCEALDVATPLVPLGILDPTDPSNPAADFNVGWVPYCDGTLFSGDRDVDSDGNGSNDRFFRGVQNLSASLDVIADTYPSPKRIVLAGISAGGAGTHYALPLVRKLYPNVPIELINDSGVGILEPGSQEALNEYWASSAFFPASCSTCIGEDGHLTDYHKYQLEQDGNIRMGFMSFAQDGVVANERLMMSGPEFEAELITAMAELEEAYPERFRSFIADGQDHTFIIRTFDVTAGGMSAREWISEMLSGSEGWISQSD